MRVGRQVKCSADLVAETVQTGVSQEGKGSGKPRESLEPARLEVASTCPGLGRAVHDQGWLPEHQDQDSRGSQ